MDAPDAVASPGDGAPERCPVPGTLNCQMSLQRRKISVPINRNLGLVGVRRPYRGELPGDKRMAGGVPVAVIRHIEQVAGTCRVAHQSGQRYELDSLIGAQPGEPALEIPRAPCEAGTPFRERAESAVDT